MKRTILALSIAALCAGPALAHGPNPGGGHHGGRDRVIIENGSTTPVLGSLAALLLLKSLTAQQTFEPAFEQPRARRYPVPPPLK